MECFVNWFGVRSSRWTRVEWGREEVKCTAKSVGSTEVEEKGRGKRRLSAAASSYRSSRRATKRAQKSGNTKTHEKNKEKGLKTKGVNGQQPRKSFPVLVLNADYQPLSYYPLSIWPWQEAVKAYYLDRVNILETYDDEIRSPSVSLKLPSVVSLRFYHKQALKGTPAFTRFNVFLRDGFCCQYCRQSKSAQDLTYDHVIPKKSGGKSCWTNIVSACIFCNSKKGSKSLKELRDMKLHRQPRVPTMYEMHVESRKFPPKYLHETWRDYLYWDTPLDEE